MSDDPNPRIVREAYCAWSSGPQSAAGAPNWTQAEQEAFEAGWAAALIAATPQEPSDDPNPRIEDVIAAKDAAYAERDRLVAALGKCAISLGGRCWLGRHVGPWEDDWRNIVFIRFPATGQMSWHIHDSELEWFSGWAERPAEPWDGHSTEEKYARLARLISAGAPYAAELHRSH